MFSQVAVNLSFNLKCTQAVRIWLAIWYFSDDLVIELMDDGKLTGTDNILSRLFFYATVRLPTLSQVSNDPVCPNYKFGSHICMNYQIFSEKPSETFAIAPTSFIAIRKLRWPRFVRIGFMTETLRLRHNDGVGESRGFIRRNIFRPAPKICHDTGYGKQPGVLEH
jgi:hypothetical protein